MGYEYLGSLAHSQLLINKKTHISSFTYPTTTQKLFWVRNPFSTTWTKLVSFIKNKLSDSDFRNVKGK